MQVQLNTPTDTYYTQNYMDTTGIMHNLIAGDFYQFRITARNIIGDSPVSEILQVMAATLPGKPGTPSRLTSTEVSITLQWAPPVDDGGSPITDYQVMWDEGTGGSFVSAGSTLNHVDFTPSWEMTTGLEYKFKVRAVNYIGAGLESDVVTLISAGPPEAPDKPYKF
jgi:hypothetical protein